MAHEIESPGVLKLCLVYAPEDQGLYARLEKQLKPLERRKLIEFWRPGDIPAGGERERELAARLAAADLFVYLLSPDLLIPSISPRPFSISSWRATGEERCASCRSCCVLCCWMPSIRLSRNSKSCQRMDARSQTGATKTLLCSILRRASRGWWKA